MYTVNLGKVAGFVTKKNVLWSNTSGNNIGSGQTITPTKPLSQCVNGWILKFKQGPQGSPKSWSFNEVYIHKYGYNSGVQSWLNVLADVNSQLTVVGKKVIITDTNIKGDGFNQLDPSSNSVLFEIVEF